ncbi:MAG: DUF2341 domain-containing protein, partial [Candidatus Aminicenantales bacterium]
MNKIKIKLSLFSLLLIFLLCGLSLGFTVSGVPGDFQYKRPITIDSTKVSGTSNLSSFPFLFNSTLSYLATTANGGKVQNSNGYDIVFASADGTTKYDHEIEKYDGTSGTFVAWVRIPTLAYNTDTVIYIYYGNTSITSSQENAAGVWSSSYKGIWHLKEDPSGTAPQMDDSTSNSNDLTTSGSMTSGDQVAGKTDGSLDLDGADDYLSRTYDSDFDFGTGSFSVSGWFKTGGSAGTETISIRVNQSSDDAEELVSDGDMYLDSSDLEMIYDSYHGGDQKIGIRFQNVTLPQGATITSAYIQFTVDETDSGTTNLTIYGEDTDNASTFSSTTGNISSRTKT